MDNQQDQQNQMETHSLNPVPNRRAINDLHFNAINTSYNKLNNARTKLNNNSQNKLNNNNVVVQNDDAKVLLLPSNHRKFIIVPSQPGSAIDSSAGTSSPSPQPPPASTWQPTGSSNINNNNNHSNSSSHNNPHVAKFEIGESSSSGPSSTLNPTFPMGPSSKPKQFHSLRSVRSATDRAGIADAHLNPTIIRTGSYIFSEAGGTPRLFSDATSIRSLASIGVGSTDGRRMVIRRVPNSPTELLTIINPPTPPDEPYDNDSYTGISDDSDIDNLKPRKQHWANKMQFVLACIGYSVGLGNVWRFPYLCYKSGGGVFLVPYFIILLFCGIPMLFMELAVGQYTGRGPIGALGQLCPLLKGTGLASVVVSFLMSTYYSVIIAYAIYYFFTSFRPDLPWTDCSHRWNTPDCWVPERMKHNISRPEMSRTPTEEFFENKVLQISHGVRM